MKKPHIFYEDYSRKWKCWSVIESTKERCDVWGHGDRPLSAYRAWEETMKAINRERE